MAPPGSFCDDPISEQLHCDDRETRSVARRRVGTAAAAIVRLCLLCSGVTGASAATATTSASTASSATAATATTAAATKDCTELSDDCVAVGGWSLSVALGAGVRTNPLAQGQDIPLVVVPQFSYYGKRFFIDNLDPGVTLLESGSNTLSLVASPGYDRVFFYRSDLQNIFIGSTTSVAGGSSPVKPPPKSLVVSTGQEPVAAKEFPSSARKVTYLAGPEWTFKHAGISGQVDYLHEITGRNHGDEIRAALGIPLGAALGGSWSANTGVTWKSAAVVNYYYGYSGLYEAGWALNPFAKISYSRPLGRKWAFGAFVHCERLGNAIADSPIVDRHYVTTAFVGATYVFHQ
jgi:outer membrane protein